MAAGERRAKKVTAVVGDGGYQSGEEGARGEEQNNKRDQDCCDGDDVVTLTPAEARQASKRSSAQRKPRSSVNGT